MTLIKVKDSKEFSTYEIIRNDIIFGRLSPNKKLKLSDMKGMYGRSVTTLREVLNRLASEGFVTSFEQRGFFVSSISKSDLREVSELRTLLECDALKISIKIGNTDWEGNVVSAYHKLKKMEQKILQNNQTDKELWKRYDWEFHQALISACGSKNLMMIHHIIYKKYLRYQMLVLTNRGQLAIDEHEGLYKSALERNEKKAIEILKQHIHEGLLHSLKEHKELPE